MGDCSLIDLGLVGCNSYSHPTHLFDLECAFLYPVQTPGQHGGVQWSGGDRMQLIADKMQKYMILSTETRL